MSALQAATRLKARRHYHSQHLQTDHLRWLSTIILNQHNHSQPPAHHVSPARLPPPRLWHSSWHHGLSGACCFWEHREKVNKGASKADFHQSFVMTKVCYTALPMSSFTTLQRKVFPVYFRLQSILLIVTALTYPPTSLLALYKAPVDAGLLAFASATALANLAKYGPATSTAMVERIHQGKRSGPLQRNGPLTLCRDEGWEEVQRPVGAQRGDAPEESGVLQEPCDEHPFESAVCRCDRSLWLPSGVQAQVLNFGNCHVEAVIDTAGLPVGSHLSSSKASLVLVCHTTSD